MRETADEPPISQADIDALVKITAGFSAIDAADQKAVAHLAKANGLTHKRLFFLQSKMMTAISLALGNKVTYLEDWPANRRVSPEELAVVKRNWDRITKPGTPMAADDY